MTYKIRILIIDPAGILPAGTVELLARTNEISLLGQTTEWGLLKRLVDAGNIPDVILYSIHPLSNREMVYEDLVQFSPTIKSILLVEGENDPNILDALAKGTNGYLKSSSELQAVLKAVVSIYRGEAVLSPCILTRILDQIKDHPG